MKGRYNEKRSTTCTYSNIYLNNKIDKLEKYEPIGALRSYTTPMDPEYCPELDETPLCGEME